MEVGGLIQILFSGGFGGVGLMVFGFAAGWVFTRVKGSSRAFEDLNTESLKDKEYQEERHYSMSEDGSGPAARFKGPPDLGSLCHR